MLKTKHFYHVVAIGIPILKWDLIKQYFWAVDL